MRAKQKRLTITLFRPNVLKQLHNFGVIMQNVIQIDQSLRAGNAPATAGFLNEFFNKQKKKMMI